MSQNSIKFSKTKVSVDKSSHVSIGSVSHHSDEEPASNVRDVEKLVTKIDKSKLSTKILLAVVAIGIVAAVLVFLLINWV